MAFFFCTGLDSGLDSGSWSSPSNLRRSLGGPRCCSGPGFPKNTSLTIPDFIGLMLDTDFHVCIDD